MPCSIVDLPYEIHLTIVQELLKNDRLIHEKSLALDQDDEFQYHRDLMNWSSTSRYFRGLLAPYILTSIKLRNDEKSGASVEAILKSPHGALVKEIYFLGTIPPGMTKSEDDEDDEDNEEDEMLDKGLWEEQDICFLGTILPGMTTSEDGEDDEILDKGFWEESDHCFTFPYGNPFEEYYKTEEFVENENPEAAHAWRALITTTYETLLRNKPRLRAVEIRSFVWTFTEPYQSQSFHQFLSHVEHFSLSVRGGDNGGGFCVNMEDGYLECVARFDELFFDHLASVTSLTLGAPAEGPIGLEGIRYARLALKEEQMPLLKSLHLEQIFVCQELVDFVVSHSDSLEQLTLYDCKSSVNDSKAHDGIYWSSFFDALHRADLKKLSHLEIWPNCAPLTFDESCHVVQEEPEDSEDVQQIRRVLSGDARRRVFGYAMLDSEYGICNDDFEEIEAAFKRGEDQVAFDRLMGNVNANAMEEKENPIGK